jgi:hypothetical protein
MNMVNQVTPYGTLTYNQTGSTTVDGNQIPQFTATEQLTPAQQSALNSQQALTQSLYNLANNQTGRITNTLSNPLSFAGDTQLATGLNPSGIVVPQGINMAALPSLPQGLNSAAINNVPTGLNTTGLPQQVSGVNFGALPQQVSGLNYNALPQMPGSPNQVDQQVANALYNSATSFLNPQWQQNAQNLQDQLSQQGIPVGSQAWTNAMTQFSNAQNQAYGNALNNAVAQGAAQGGTNYGLALQGVQTGVNTQVANAGLANQAGQFGLNSQVANAALANQAGQFGLSAQGLNSQIANTGAQTQLAEQGLNSQIANQAFQNQLGAQTQNAAVANQAASTNLAQQQANAQLEQNARQQQIQEQTYLYNQPLNEAIALMGGGQIQGPSLVNTPQTNIQPTNVLGAYALQNQAQEYNYGQQMANNNAMLGGLFGLAGAGLNGGTGGFGSSAIGSLLMSSHEFKEPGTPVDTQGILESVSRLPVERWKYKDGIEDGGEHIGPYAEDFAREFGGDGKRIPVVDALGVLTASIQALTSKLDQMEERIGQIESLLVV